MAEKALICSWSFLNTDASAQPRSYASMVAQPTVSLAQLPAPMTLDGKTTEPVTLFEIANGIGVPVKIDHNTLERRFGLFARVLVDVDLSCSPPCELVVRRSNGEIVTVEVEYERLPDFCSHCGNVSHRVTDCKLVEKPGSVVVEENEEGRGCSRKPMRRRRKFKQVYVAKEADKGKQVVIDSTTKAIDDSGEGPSFVRKSSSLGVGQQEVVTAMVEKDDASENGSENVIELEHGDEEMLAARVVLEAVLDVSKQKQNDQEHNGSSGGASMDAINSGTEVYDSECELSSPTQNVSTIPINSWYEETEREPKFTVVAKSRLVGDYNAVLGSHEKKGGAPVCAWSCEEFQAMSDICQLVHIDTKGAQFTWARRRGVRDHNLLIMSFSKDFGARHSLFRFRKMWVEHTDFNNFVKQCWGLVVTYGCPLSVLQHKLWVLRKALWVWNWEVFGNIHKKVDDDLTALAQIQHDIATSGDSDDLLAKESVLHASLTESLRIREMFWREKSRQRWLAEGDRNTSYFHAMCRVRKAQSSITLLREGSQLFEDCASIQNHILDYYTNIFAKDRGCHDTGLVSRVIPSLVTEEENNRLIEVPSSDEIWSAIKSMDPESAPGLDGFNGHFFVSCWDIVGRDVVAAVQYFFRIDIASRIISPQQHAFVKGRNISDCIMTTSKCFNLLDNKCYGGNVAIKVDITKAFDTLSWDFLARVLQAFGFHHVFVTWVRNLLHSTKFSLQINGRSVGFFSYGRGVRQGDPLSPLLFCLAEEALSRGLSHLMNSRQLHPISSPRGTCAPSHALFADDIIVFCRGDRSSLAVIMDFLGEYGVNSGQVINKAKSQVFISKHLSYRHHLIVDLLGIPEGTTPFTYLGVPIFRGKPMVSHFQYIVDKIRLRFSSWKGSLLSMAGRVQLIKSVMASMVVYSFQIYEWPVNLLSRLEVRCRNFLWSGSMDKRGVPLVAWKTCCALMDEGGLGLKQLVVLNRSLLLKKAWEIYSSTSEGCSFLRNHFWRNGALRRSYASSSIWPCIKRFWQHVIDNGCWLLGSNS
ncbi:hypothetical protein ACLB2K_004523 [Fragaria x ananassa]